MRKHFTQTNRERVDARVLRKQVSQQGDRIVYKTERIETGAQFEQPCIMIKWSTPPWEDEYVGPTFVNGHGYMWTV